MITPEEQMFIIAGYIAGYNISYESIDTPGDCGVFNNKDAPYPVFDFIHYKYEVCSKSYNDEDGAAFLTEAKLWNSR